jgi:hypothetical protein
MPCPECDMISINGIACHEIGCPNARKRYEPAEDIWITQQVCSTCGFQTDYNVPCCNEDEEWDADT